MNSLRPTRESLRQELLQQGRELSARIILFHEALVGRFGLNGTDHKCLDLARHEPRITPGRLAQLTGLTTGAITAALDRLERAGFVRRERDHDDRRRVSIRVLPEGARRLAPHFGEFARAMDELHGRYSADELRLLCDYHVRCIGVLKAHTPSGAPAPAPAPRAGHPASTP